MIAGIVASQSKVDYRSILLGELETAKGFLITAESQYLWQNTGGTTPVTTDGDTIRRIDDQSVNGFNGTVSSSTISYRPIYRTTGGEYLETTSLSTRVYFDVQGPFDGLFIYATRKGIYAVDKTFGATDPYMSNFFIYAFLPEFIGAFIIEGKSTADTSLIDTAKQFFTSLGAVESIDASSINGLYAAFAYGFKSIPTLPASLPNCDTARLMTFRSTDIDNSDIPSDFFDKMPNATTVQSVFQRSGITSVTSGWFDSLTSCIVYAYAFAETDITSLPDGLFDNSPNVTNFTGLCNDCTLLTDVPAGLFDNQTVCSAYQNAFQDCALTQQSVDNILASVWTSANTNNIQNGTLDLNSGTSSAPSASGLTNKTNLEGLGWVVRVNT
ncbi:hypothetical protein [Francisella marina]|uniref:hypothetical protein n=1 Tax=Francisella marina TaxID=2249302 RepID=UPI0011F07C62|nr:hypothetical protein [Francisella marina]QEO58340.1 hypothetical protein F0R75_00585 [Francisella marina]